MTIYPLKQEDEGYFTCHAINRVTGAENPVLGPDADVYIMEPCSERDEFCFPNKCYLPNNHVFDVWISTLILIISAD